MTPYEIGGLVFLSMYYCVKWWRKNTEKAWERARESWKQLDNFDLCHERHRVDNNINTEAKVVAITPQGIVYDRSIIKGSFNTLLYPGIKELFEEQTGVYEVRIGVDPVETIYDDEYWRILKERIRREREEE